MAAPDDRHDLPDILSVPRNNLGTQTFHVCELVVQRTPRLFSSTKLTLKGLLLLRPIRMAAASDKSRFFLEQSVPELREYERKKIFSPEEISSIAKKRSDLEHKINARGSTATDYARYAEFEINVEALRKKRVKRLGVKATNHNGQRRIFFVFDRGTKKHSGDVGLWMQSIEYARSQRAYKKLGQIFTNVLRLHPSRPELWIYAAQFAMEENGDMTEARAYMQRGLRFCKSKRQMWLQYLRLEMSYLSKLHARRQILGIETDEAEKVSTIDVQEQVPDLAASITADVNDTKITDMSQSRTEILEEAPSSTVAIALAVFDSAMSQFNHDSDLAHSFIDTVAEYEDLPAAKTVFEHIRNHSQLRESDHWTVVAAQIREPIFGVPTSSIDFPAALRASLKKLRQSKVDGKQSHALRQWAVVWLQSLLSKSEIDPAIETVIRATMASLDHKEVVQSE